MKPRISFPAPVFEAACTSFITLAIAAFSGWTAFALAQPVQAAEAYPERSIVLVVPYPPGGSNDVFARVIAKELSETLGQSVVVDNKAGASGTIGTAAVARAAPDGYTLVAVSSSMTTNAAVQTKLPFDPVKDLTPVAMFAEGPFIVAVNKDFPATTPQELIAAIRARPGAYNYASSGPGSVNHFGTELLKAQAGDLPIEHIPYRGMGPAITDLVGGQTQVLMSSGPSLLPTVRSGKVRAVGITSATVSPIAPDLQPMSSAVPGYEYALWWGLFGPAGLPPAVVEKLNAAVNGILQRKEIQAQFLAEGAEARPLSAARFAEVVKGDVERWKRLAKERNITAN